MPTVKLINYTIDALNLLLHTKNTRLSNDDDPATWSEEKKAEHLAYMLDTIKSSWEFVDYVFEISGVTRSFTHQFVRTRTGHYAQESQRTVDVRSHEVVLPIGCSAAQRHGFYEAVAGSIETYGNLIDSGMAVQDARGVLPANIATSIIAKFDLRTISHMAETRLCERTQGEYQSVFRLMREQILQVHPWASDFIQVHCVAHGTCAFPRYGKTSCQHYDPRMDLSELKKELKVKFWEKEIKAAIPIAKDGKTM